MQSLNIDELATKSPAELRSLFDQTLSNMIENWHDVGAVRKLQFLTTFMHLLLALYVDSNLSLVNQMYVYLKAEQPEWSQLPVEFHNCFSVYVNKVQEFGRVDTVSAQEVDNDFVEAVLQIRDKQVTKEMIIKRLKQICGCAQRKQSFVFQEATVTEIQPSDPAPRSKKTLRQLKRGNSKCKKTLQSSAPDLTDLEGRDFAASEAETGPRPRKGSFRGFSLRSRDKTDTLSKSTTHLATETASATPSRSLSVTEDLNKSQLSLDKTHSRSHNFFAWAKRHITKRSTQSLASKDIWTSRTSLRPDYWEKAAPEVEEEDEVFAATPSAPRKKTWSFRSRNRSEATALPTSPPPPPEPEPELEPKPEPEEDTVSVFDEESQFSFSTASFSVVRASPVEIWDYIGRNPTEKLLTDKDILRKMRDLAAELDFAPRWVMTLFAAALVLEQSVTFVFDANFAQWIVQAAMAGLQGSTIIDQMIEQQVKVSSQLHLIVTGLADLVQGLASGEEKVRHLVVQLVDNRLGCTTQGLLRRFSSQKEHELQELFKLLKPLLNPEVNEARQKLVTVLKVRQSLIHTEVGTTPLERSLGQALDKRYHALLFPFLSSASVRSVGSTTVDWSLFRQMRVAQTDALFLQGGKTFEAVAEDLEYLGRMVLAVKTEGQLAMVVGHAVQCIFLVLEEEEQQRLGMDITHLYVIYFKALLRLTRHPAATFTELLRQCKGWRDRCQALNSHVGMLVAQAIVFQAVCLHFCRAFANAHPLRLSLPIRPAKAVQSLHPIL